MTTDTLSLRGHPFFVRRWGDPDLPPMLLLHGFPEFSGAWAQIAPHLAGRFHCIAPDQRGYGQSYAPDDVDAYKPKELIADMAALIEASGGPMPVFGHDWGAAVAYGLAITHPHLVTRLIIANGTHPVPFQRALAAGGAQTAASQYITFLRRDGSQDVLAADDFAKMMQLFSAKMACGWLDGPLADTYKAEWARDGRLKTMIHWYRASPLQVPPPGERLDGLPDYPVDKLMVRCPHLLIWGLNDTALLPEATEGLETFAPDLTRVDIADADHWLLHQKPAEVAGIVLSWLDRKAKA